MTVHRSWREQWLDGLLLGGQTGSVKTSSGLWLDEKEPGLSQHQRLGNLHRKSSQIRSAIQKTLRYKCNLNVILFSEHCGLSASCPAGLTEAGTGSTLKSSLCSLSDISDSEDISNKHWSGDVAQCQAQTQTSGATSGISTPRQTAIFSTVNTWKL